MSFQLTVVYLPHNASDWEEAGLFCDWQGKNLKSCFRSGQEKNVSDGGYKKENAFNKPHTLYNLR